MMYSVRPHMRADNRTRSSGCGTSGLLRLAHRVRAMLAAAYVVLALQACEQRSKARYACPA